MSTTRPDSKIMQLVKNQLSNIKKKSGEVVLFNYDKLQRSISLALKSAGVKDNPISGKVADEVIRRLVEDFNTGSDSVVTADVREIVEIVLLEQGLTNAAQKYHSYRKSYEGVQSDDLFHQPAAAAFKASSGSGLDFSSYFSKNYQDPYDSVSWEKRSAVLTNSQGEIIYDQKDIEVPTGWSQTALNIVASKYFYGDQHKDERENSVRQLINRVTRTITDWGQADGYFASEQAAENFYKDLSYLVLNQYGTFNSPVWFNCGVHRYDKGSGVGRYYWDKELKQVKLADDDYQHPQCSACFILSVEDTMESILDLVKTEGMIFKFGSGSGYNLSPLRSSAEHLSGGGLASGPVSFMKGYDAFAGVIKSGGKTRRAAKMVILDVAHPDIMEFVEAKIKEEKKAWALIDAGYDGAIDGEAYTSIFFQNANHSVRVTDEFMQAVENNDDWQTKGVHTGEPVGTYKAREILQRISEGTHICGDPGIQFDTIINDWHTCSNSGRITASNPCSEYMFLNDTACNLVSLNLLKFRKLDGSFDIEGFQRAVDIFFTAQEIIVDNASYPTAALAHNSHIYRTIGLGYANLGALLMSLGLPYDSDEGRSYAAAISALLTGQAYNQSARMAESMGPFPGFADNKEPTTRVMTKHLAAVDEVAVTDLNQEIITAAHEAWQDVVARTKVSGLRNAQATVLAPTGTIAFMMDCDTTGVEPDIALVKYKKLVGGGYIKIVNSTVGMALHRLGYTKLQISEIIDYIDKNDTIEGAPHLKTDDLDVFDCAFRPAKGSRFIHHLGHLKMMGAVQPFISGAISKTVNMPTESTVAEIMDAYIQGWKLGLKALAIYRDGSKRIQPLNTNKEGDSQTENKNTEVKKKAEDLNEELNQNTMTTPAANNSKPRRRRLPDERRSITHKFTIGSHDGYLTVGLYDDNSPGEIFITIAKEGSVMSGLMDAFATSISIALQYGVPLKVLANKFVHMRFEPSGYTSNEHIRIAKSIVDYIFRWLAMKFLSPEEKRKLGINNGNDIKNTEGKLDARQKSLLDKNLAKKSEVNIETGSAYKNETLTFDNQSDAPACNTCGEIMIRNGSCYKCLNCGATSGCS